MSTDPRPVGPGRPAPAADPLRILLVAPPMLPVPPPTLRGHRAGRRRARRRAAPPRAPRRRSSRPATRRSRTSTSATIDESLWSAGYSGRLEAYQQHTIEVAWRGRRALRHRPRAHGAAQLRVRRALRDAGDHHAPRPARHAGHAGAARDAPGRAAGRDQREPAAVLSRTSAGSRRSTTACRWATMPFRDRARRLPRVRRPDHAREGHPRTRSSSAARRGSGSRSRPRSTSSPSTRTSTRSCSRRSTTGAIDFLGELGPEERDPLYAGALATVMLGGWPEPFGLVAIESMATGTPVIARRAGALIETVIHGETGFIVDDVDEAVLAVERVAELDRRRSASSALAPVLAGADGRRVRGRLPPRCWPSAVRGRCATPSTAPVPDARRGRRVARPATRRGGRRVRAAGTAPPGRRPRPDPRSRARTPRARASRPTAVEAAADASRSRSPAATRSASGRRPGPTRR